MSVNTGKVGFAAQLVTKQQPKLLVLDFTQKILVGKTTRNSKQIGCIGGEQFVCVTVPRREPLGW